MNGKKPKLISSPNKIISTIIIIVFFVLVYLNANFLIAIYDSIVLSVQQPFNNIATKINDYQTTFSQFENILHENETLKQKNIDLLQENNKLFVLEEENRQLQKLLDYSQNNHDYKYITGQVYAQDSINLTNTIQVDQGQNDGVKVGDHVLLGGIYIGRIIEANDHTAWVRVITSPGLLVVGQISSINTNGIVSGQIGFGLIMKDIPPDANLQVGQVVTTTAIDANMPADLLLGEVIEVKHNDQNIFQEATLKPYFDLKEIKYVLIKINDQ
ncbi:MAG: rod shape-determining protein MreC [Patescibacteria group bacterium]